MTNQTRASIPHASFRAMKEAVLGKDYELGLTIVTATHIKKLNKIYRNQDRPTDILSFPLSRKSGEIYICPSATRAEAKKFNRSYDNFVPFLFIHGLVHLKGYDHGATMERIEAKVRARFKI
ncbi:MAG: rRNA maturation RNase YbeY [Candidatus Paceibacterota bacterium]